MDNYVKNQIQWSIVKSNDSYNDIYQDDDISDEELTRIPFELLSGRYQISSE